MDYNEFGQMTEIVRGNNTVTSYIYDIKGRLSKLVTTTSSNSVISKIQNVTYSFKVDNSIASSENIPDISTEGMFSGSVRYDYKYDGLNRLVHAEGNLNSTYYENGEPVSDNKQFERGYSYAPSGNLNGKTLYDPATGNPEEAWSYTYSNHSVNSIGTTSYGTARFTMNYDNAGNMIFHEDNEKNVRKNMAYDSFNRIKTVTNPDAGLPDTEVIGRYWYDDQAANMTSMSFAAFPTSCGSGTEKEK